MKEVIEDINRWQNEKQTVALATVVQTWGSAPRKVGAKMALTPDGAISGSVSGGCVEGAVFEEGTAALETNKPKLLHYGVATAQRGWATAEQIVNTWPLPKLLAFLETGD